ncbi:MAG: PD-(D/E)XK nuclease family protein [Candidatus Omnitrophica bacterium]|nr:PD-(D/E)XK nuclease family protein [Candidatus Omnitrophota bacterium]
MSIWCGPFTPAAPCMEKLFMSDRLITIPLTERFLDHAAAYIEREYIVPGKDMRRLAVVFGGHRPSLFLKRMLADKIKGPFTPPRFLTMDELVTMIIDEQGAGPGQTCLPAPGFAARRAGRVVCDLEHSLVLYHLVRRHTPQILKDRESFARFLPWAKEITHFIEQMDLEDTGDDVLKALGEQARIGFSVPQDINRLLEDMMVLRRAYHAHLDKEGLCVRGYRYWKAGRGVSAWDAASFDRILFCNIFYLHATEMAVVKDLYDRKKAVLMVQGDQRRWPALERISRVAGSPVVEGDQVSPTSFDLFLHAAFDMHSQAGLIAEVLCQVPDPASAVIVLPDAEFMLPLLSVLGEGLGDFNISMGYPLRRSSLHALLESIIAAQASRRDGLYYARDYLKVLRHPLVKELDRAVIHKVEEVLTGDVRTPLSGKLFLALKDVGDILSKVHQHLFEAWQNVRAPRDLARALNGLLSFMAQSGRTKDDPLNARIAERLGSIADEFAALKGAEPFADGELFKVLLERLKGEMVAFSGSPLRGLQVLGLFETRSLSFKDVIVADVNEGMLPNLNVYEPLIPREVMVKLKLNRLEFEEEIQRYQFMRLLSCAERVHLVYQERPDKQRSRFIEELVWEQEKREGILGAVAVHRPGFRAEIPAAARSAPKTPVLIDFLKAMTFSATSVNTYAHNPYEFYFKYVLGLKEKDDLLDDPEGKHVGIFVHALLEEAFRRFKGRKPVLDAAFGRYFRGLFETHFEQTFGGAMASDAFLMKEVLSARLQRFLEQEARRCERVAQVLYLEHAFEDVIHFPCGPVKFVYRVDRVDRTADGTIMIIDYKTGGANRMPVVTSFQMPLYVHYLDRLYPDEPVNAAIYHLRTSKLETFLDDAGPAGRTIVLPQFMTALGRVMAQIFDPAVPFTDKP